ncbi:MAG: signal peptidase II [Proteobacteria bacterium]|nr:MAG: signal peptidase II [Pseudomonadota bacterium]
MFARGLVTAIITLIIDQASKWYLLEIFRLPSRGVVEVLPFFNLTMVWNRGISFGLFPADGDHGRWFLVAFTLVVAGVVILWLKKAEDRLAALALGLILGGALGNIIDRIRFGAVADFVQLHAAGYSFFIFNVADAAISVGVALLFLDAILSHRGAKTRA